MKINPVINNIPDMDVAINKFTITIQSVIETNVHPKYNYFKDHSLPSEIL